ncbi:hypothetical protein Fcan01_10987 [Folsomia candida]|uniref:Uncharacterized protein n=1 Tax=Folsomia candida TaxID=158441 RepID=A0A226E6Y1_FOLCA|nr:hypothetical protein Fcan01_10987 [Folsomia candida]
METMIDIVQFFNAFTSTICLPTFIIEQNHLNVRDDFDFFDELQVTLPILLLTSIDILLVDRRYSRAILPSYFRYRYRYRDQVIQVCSNIYYVGLAKLSSQTEMIDKLRVLSRIFVNIPTSHKFIIAAIPPDLFSSTISLLDSITSNVDLKIFLVEMFNKKEVHGNGNKIAYYSCIHCPSNHAKIIETPDSPEMALNIFTWLVKIEQKSLSDNARSTTLGKFVSSRRSYDIIDQHEFSVGVAKVAEYLKNQYNQETFDFNYFTRAHRTLEVFDFDQILDFILLEEAFKQNLSISSKRLRNKLSYFVPKFQDVIFFVAQNGNVFYTFIGEMDYNFITCDGMQSLLRYELYLTPADIYCWALSILAIVIVSAIIVFPNLSGNYIFEMGTRIIDLFGVLIEKPITMKFHITPKLSLLLLSIWIWSSLILYTGWKAAFTTEVIKPTIPTSRFKGFQDLINFTFYFPIKEEYYEVYENPALGAFIPELQLIFRYLKNSKEPGIADLSHATMAMNVETGYTRIFPMAYKYPDHFLGNLTKEGCKNKAYVDTKDSICRILPYSNRRMKKFGVRFAKGERVLRTNPKGWMWLLFGDGRQAEGLIRRQKGIISSGIYKYWSGLYEQFGKVKLFQFYDEEAELRKKDVTEGMKIPLGLESKIVSSIVIFFISCAISLIVFLAEVFYFMYEVLA